MNRVVLDSIIERSKKFVHALPVAYIWMCSRVEKQDIGELGLDIGAAEERDIGEAEMMLCGWICTIVNTNNMN